MELALFQPEIPQNTGTLIRLCACMGIGLHVIFPCGFVFRDKHLQRASLDYKDMASVLFHEAWETFVDAMEDRRLILLTPSASSSHIDFSFEKKDCLILGRESSGFPASLLESMPHQVKIPMVSGMRSLNVAISGAMVLSEALRQTHLYP